MTWPWITLWLLGSGWLGWLIAFGWYDERLRRDHLHRLEVREWQEKVQAMRRLQDEEGDA